MREQERERDGERRGTRARGDDRADGGRRVGKMLGSDGHYFESREPRGLTLDLRADAVIVLSTLLTGGHRN